MSLMTNERKQYCECLLYLVERDSLRKISPGLDPKILFDIKKRLGTVIMCLDSLLQLIC